MNNLEKLNRTIDSLEVQAKEIEGLTTVHKKYKALEENIKKICDNEEKYIEDLQETKKELIGNLKNTQDLLLKGANTLLNKCDTLEKISVDLENRTNNSTKEIQNSISKEFNNFHYQINENNNTLNDVKTTNKELMRDLLSRNEENIQKIKTSIKEKFDEFNTNIEGNTLRLNDVLIEEKNLLLEINKLNGEVINSINEVTTKNYAFLGDLHTMIESKNNILRDALESKISANFSEIKEIKLEQEKITVEIQNNSNNVKQQLSNIDKDSKLRDKKINIISLIVIILLVLNLIIKFIK